MGPGGSPRPVGPGVRSSLCSPEMGTRRRQEGVGPVEVEPRLLTAPLEPGEGRSPGCQVSGGRTELVSQARAAWRGAPLLGWA